MSMRVDALIEEYQLKSKLEGFDKLGDATEALATTRDYQLKGWLCDYILRWETVESIERGEFGPDHSEAQVLAEAMVQILGTPRNSITDRALSIARNALKRVQGLKNGSLA